MEAVINELSGQLTRVNDDLAISQDMLMVGKRELEELKSEQKEMANACNHYKQELRSCRKEREALESKIQLIETEFEKQSALNEILPQRQGQVEKMGSDLVSRFDAESKRSRQRIVNVVAKANNRASRRKDVVEETAAALLRVSQARGENRVLRDQARLKRAAHSQELAFLENAIKKTSDDIERARKQETTNRFS